MKYYEGMKIGFILLILLSFGLWQKFKKPSVALSTLPTPNACQGKKLCAIVYLAPWCPACEQVTPVLKTFLVNSKTVSDYGFQIIVGDERTPGENKRKAQSLGDGTIVDSDMRMARDMKVTYYPTFYVVDSVGKVQQKDQAAMTWANEHFAGK